MTASCMTWPLVLRPGQARRAADLPRRVLTLTPGFRDANMPDEVGLLLPTSAGPKQLVQQVVEAPARCHEAMLGLFLAGPFLNIELEARRLSEADVGWIANLPSVAQHDLEFSLQLSDVGLDHQRELAALGRFRAQGFKVAAVVTDGRNAAAAAAHGPEALLVLPRVGDFAAGFPSLRQRGAAAQAVAEAARGGGWSGLIFGLADANEAAHEALWPEPLDGVVCRPRPA